MLFAFDVGLKPGLSLSMWFIHVQDILIHFCNVMYIISNMLDNVFNYICAM
jgi:hypothetical protein